MHSQNFQFSPTNPQELEQTLRYSALIGRPIDNTVLSAYLSCARKGLYMAWLHRRYGGPPTPALGFGGGWHYVMESHFKAPEMSAEDLFDRVQLFTAEHWEDHQVLDDYRTFQRAMVEYKKYVKQYGLPWKEEGRTVGWPYAPLVEISVEVPIPGARHPYAGKMDRIFELQGNNYVEDHKTTSRADSFAQYEMDNQMIGYAAEAQILTGLPIAGVRVDRVVVRKNDSEMERRIFTYTESRIQQWHRNYDNNLEKLEHDLELYAQDSDIATTRGFPLNFSACHAKFGMCQYAGVCSLPPELWAGALMDDFVVNPWNPLEVKGDGDDA